MGKIDSGEIKKDVVNSANDEFLEEILFFHDMEKGISSKKESDEEKERILKEILKKKDLEGFEADSSIKDNFSSDEILIKENSEIKDFKEPTKIKVKKNKEASKKTLKIAERRKSKEIKDVLLDLKSDRRLLSYVPDSQAIRSNIDRRGKKTLEDFKGDATAYIKSKQYGERYNAVYEVLIECKTGDGKKRKIHAQSVDISTTGILLRIEGSKGTEILKESKKIRLKFEITPGSMPEGYEMKVNIAAKLVRTQTVKEGEFLCGFEFEETLAQYANRTRGRYLLASASLFLFLTTFFILLMRAESIIYFKFNKYLYLYSIIAAVFLLSRYLFGALYKPV
ncbi:MAG: PilZ domain-containing protein, partial [Oscillospiraceae bacterium]|nr:PilZ domain-containing protein [Oscillospiraceae bacterium]